MSLLEDLKKKAESLQTEEQQRSEQTLQNVTAVDQKLRKIFSYINELAKTLAVIKPEVPKPYVLGTAGTFEGLCQADHFADYRTNNLQDRECFDSVSFLFKSVAPQTLNVPFDDPFLAERFEKLLWEYSVIFKRDDVLNAQRKIAKVNFRVPCEVRSEILFQGEHEAGLVRITCKNIGYFGHDELVFEHDEIDTAWLDELAKFVMGQPTPFKLGGKRQQQVVIPPRPVELPVPKYEIHETPEVAKEEPSGLLETVKGLWGIWKK